MCESTHGCHFFNNRISLLYRMSKQSPQSVLIVEDRTDIARRLQTVVESTSGITLAGMASTLSQGIEVFYHLKPRLVLVDIGLPDGSGVDLIKAVASAEWEVDALVISIFGDESRVIEAIQAGAKGYVLKGQEMDKVGEDIMSVLEGGSPISPSIARHLLAVLKEANVPSMPKESVLTQRETEILKAVSRGYKRREIADQLGISAGTVGNHITNIYRKLEVSSNMEAVAHASRLGVL